MIPVSVEGKVYYKSSLSAKSFKCVGVRRDGDRIWITNTNTDGPNVDFTFEEWKIFIDGVKAGEFDKL